MHDWRALYLKKAVMGIYNCQSHASGSTMDFLVCGEQLDCEKTGKRMLGIGLKVPVSTGH